MGRLRYLGLVLYDADKVLGAAATEDPRDLYHARLSVFLDPDDPKVQAAAARQGVPADWLDAARRSPTYALIARHRVALPFHPEYRTLPMVWYIPPLSPVSDTVTAAGYTPRILTRCSPPSSRCACRRSTWPTCSPRATRARSAGCCARSRPCAVMRAGQLGLEVPDGLAESVGLPRRTWRTCTGCWPSPSTRSATSWPSQSALLAPIAAGLWGTGVVLYLMLVTLILLHWLTLPMTRQA